MAIIPDSTEEDKCTIPHATGRRKAAPDRGPPKLIAVIALFAAIWCPIAGARVVSAAEFYGVRLHENVEVRKEAVAIEERRAVTDAGAVFFGEVVLAFQSLPTDGSIRPDYNFYDLGVLRGVESSGFGHFRWNLSENLKSDQPKINIPSSPTIVDQGKTKRGPIGLWIPVSSYIQIENQVTALANNPFDKEIGALQIDQSTFRNAGGFASCQPQPDGGDEKQPIEQHKSAGEHRDWIVGPVLPIKTLGLIFIIGCGASGLVMWLLAKWQDRILP